VCLAPLPEAESTLRVDSAMLGPDAAYECLLRLLLLSNGDRSALSRFNNACLSLKLAFVAPILPDVVGSKGAR
jgi:hypothetical protein